MSGRARRLRGRETLPASARGKVLYLASSDEKGIAKPTAQLAAALQRARPALQCIHRPMPQETHGTLYHPAALQAFRTVFKPRPAAP